MRFCTKCGKQLTGTEDFCGNCGAKVNRPPEQKQVVNQELPAKKSKKPWIVLIAIVVIAAIAIAAIVVISSGKKEKEYNNYISSAEKYMEELDYEQAEIAYLNAIEIDKKQLKPYVDLAEIYIEEERYDEAEEILDKAEEAGAKGDEETVKEQETLEEILDNKDTISDYDWFVSATMEFEDVFLLKESTVSPEDTVNELKKQCYQPYAVIQKDGNYGLINIDGEVLVEPKYQRIYMYGNTVFLETDDPVYVAELGWECNIFSYYNGVIEPVGGLGGPGAGEYYYCNGLQVLYDVFENLMTDSLPTYGFPVQQSASMFPENYELMQNWISRLYEGKYAIFRQNGLVTDFIFDECGSYSDGLFAVCQDGKWGYVNQDGEIVIPIEYDLSWEKYDKVYDYETDEINDVSFCYGASNGFVVLCKEDKWEIRTTSGELVIPAGMFEKILPVYEGKCWVKQNGKWGVIELEDHRP